MNNFYMSQSMSAHSNDNVIKTFNINPSLIHAEVISGVYYFTFQNYCFNGSSSVFGTHFDQNVLKDKLTSWLKPDDRKYIKIVSYDTTKSKFAFDIDRWLDDSFTGVKARTSLVRFQRVYSLKVMPPFMVRSYGQRIEFERYVGAYFKDYCKEHPKLRKTVFNIITNEVERTLNINAVNFFDYSYDYGSNHIAVTLKSAYQMTVMAAIVAALNKDDKTKSMGFTNSVVSNLKAFEFMSK